MSLADQLQRVIYKLRTEGADKVQKDFTGIEEAAADVAREAINVEKAVATIGIQAEETRGRLQRMVDSAGGSFTSLKGTLGQIGGGFQSSIKGLNDMIGRLGPWNQALELGGKAVKFVDESFDALAAKEPGRRKEIEETRKSFKGLGDDIKQVTAELVLFVADGWKPAEDALKKARETDARVRKMIAEHFGLDRGSASAQGLGYVFNGGFAADASRLISDPWGGGLDEAVSEGIGKIEAANKKLAESRKKMADEWAKRQREVREFASITGMDTPAPVPSEASAKARADALAQAMGVKADTTQRNAYGVAQDEGDLLRSSREAYAEWVADMESAEQRYSEFVNRKSRPALEALFGPVEEIDLYIQSLQALGQTFTAFSGAVASGYEAIVTGQAGIAEAFKKTLAAGLLSIGKSSVVEALRQTALGFGALAFGSPTASLHFKSAAMHGAVAIAAGAAAAGLGAGSSSGASASGGGASSSSSSSGGSLSDKIVGGDKREGKETYVVAYLDPFANQPEHIRRQQAREMIANVMGKGPVEDN